MSKKNSSVKTNKILSRLETVVDFTIGKDRSKPHKIVVGESSPATDGTKIYLPRKNNHYKKAEDNELCLANSTAHESDHIVECYEYFGDEMIKMIEAKEQIIGVYLKKNYSHLTENPTLAAEIDNIVKDRRIDYVRRENFPGIKKHYVELSNPAMKYFRPSINGMNELDAFRELYLQKALIGSTVDAVPEKYAKLLEEVVSLTNTADNIHNDPRIVTKIYEIFKNNFDIKQPISKLPQMFGSNKHPTNSPSNESQGQPQNSYGKPIKEREGRTDDNSEPKELNDDSDSENSDEDKDNKNKTNAGTNTNNNNSKPSPRENKNDKDFYSRASKDDDFQVEVMESNNDRIISKRENNLRNLYTGEIESMKQIFKRLQLRNYGLKKDIQGQDIDYDDYMQSDLESKVTRIKGGGKYFNIDVKNVRKPAFGIHADISRSTEFNGTIKNIRAALYIIGNALSTSDWNYGLYASNDILQVIKSPTKKWDDSINGIISELDGSGSGIYLEQTSSIIGADLKRLDANPKCMIVLSDFEVCGNEHKEMSIAKKLKDQNILPFYIAIGSENKGNVEQMTKEIGDEYHSVIPMNKLYELPNEIFRILKTYGAVR